MTRYKLGTLIASAFLLLTSAGIALAHDYSAPFFYISGVYSSDAERAYPPASNEEMAWLLKQIQSDDKGVRAIAAGALGQTKDPRAVEPLLKALKDKASFVQMNAAMAFVHISDPRAIEPLKSFIGDREEGYGSLAALYALAAQGEAGLKAIKQSLAKAGRQNPGMPGADEELAQAVLVAKGDTAVDWAVAKLKSSDPDFKCTALTILSYMVSSEESKAQLTKILADPAIAQAISDFAVSQEDAERISAVEILIAVNNKAGIDRVITALQNKKFQDTDNNVLWMLAKTNDPRLKPLLADVRKRNSDPDDELEASLNHTDKEIAKLVKAIRSSDEIDADEVISNLSRSTNPKAVQALVRLMHHKNQTIASAAMLAMAHSNNSAMVNRVVNEAKNPNSKLSNKAKQTLLSSSSPNLLPFYVYLLNDKDPKIAQLSVMTLGNMRDRRATPHLLALLKNNKEVSVGIEALGMLKDPQAIDALLTLLGTKEEANAKKLIGALAAYENVPIEPLIAKLKDPNPVVRSRAAQLFGIVKDARTVEPLKAALNDENSKVRKLVVDALIYQEDAGGIQAAAKLISDQDPNVREAAILASAQQPAPGSADTLAAMLKSKKRPIRVSTGVALGLLGDKRGADAVVEVLTPNENEEESEYDSPDLILSAIRAAGVLKEKRAVKTILGTLGGDISMSTFEHVSEEQHKHSRDTKINALRNITGQDFGYAYYRWMAYWIAQGNDFGSEMFQ